MLKFKSRLRFFLSFTTSLGLIFSSVAILLQPALVVAATSNSSTNKIKDLEQQIQSKDEKVKELEAESDRLQGKIEQAQDQQKTLANQLAIFDTQIDAQENELDATQEKIDSKTLEIEKKQLEIDEVERQIHEKKKLLGELVQRLDEYDSTSSLEILLGFGKLSDFLNQADQINELQKRSKEALDQIKELRITLSGEESILQDEQRQLNDLKNQQEDDLAKLESSRRSKAFLLEKTEADEAQFLALVEDAEKLKNTLQSEQDRLRSSLAAAIIEAKQIAQVPESSGVLAWPVNPHPLTAFFHDPAYYSLFGFHHTGLDIDGETGDTIMAADNGVVVVTGYGTTGYGNYIDILHSGGVVTRYGHLSQINVVKGQTVVKGQAIGAMGSTGFSTGSHLHFEVRINDGQTAVDPLSYL